MFTLAADDFNSHAGMIIPVNSLEAQETRRDWLFQVRMFHCV